MSGQEIVKAQGYASLDLMGADFDRVERMAAGLAKSGMFKDVTTTQQAFAKILLGADMGLTPTQALMSIDVVRGNVQIRGKRLLAWIRASENYDYDVLERSPERGAIRFFQKSKRTGEWAACEPDIAFTLEEAKAKGLVKAGGGWDNWPENMCLWRCASIGYNLFCSDLGGGVSVYTEADSFVDSSATEIGAGEGSGEAPPWDGVSDEHVARVEELMARAEAIDFLGLPDMGTVRMKLNGQFEAAVEEWVAAAEAQVAIAVAAVEAKATEGGE